VPKIPISSDFFSYLPSEDSSLMLNHAMTVSNLPNLSLNHIGHLFSLDEGLASAWSQRLLSENATQTRYGFASYNED
jgi:hypothetical protein